MKSECGISAEIYAIYKVTRNSRSKLMHRVMNGSFYCTLARNFCWQSPTCTNPSQFQIHFRYSSKTSVHLTCQKRFERTQHILQHKYNGPGRKHCFHFTPVLSEKFSLHRKINHEHQVLFEEKIFSNTGHCSKPRLNFWEWDISPLPWAIYTTVVIKVFCNKN